MPAYTAATLRTSERTIRRASINVGTDAAPNRQALRLVRLTEHAGPGYYWIDAGGGLIDECHGATVARAVERLHDSYSLRGWDLRVGGR